MPTLLDDIKETHDGPEPRVLTEDVQAILRLVVRPGDDDSGEAVNVVAKNADLSARTVYRVLNPTESKPSLSLDTADALVMACGRHLRACRLVWPNGQITGSDYRWSAEQGCPVPMDTPEPLL